MIIAIGLFGGEVTVSFARDVQLAALYRIDRTLGLLADSGHEGIQLVGMLQWVNDAPVPCDRSCSVDKFVVRVQGIELIFVGRTMNQDAIAQVQRFTY